MVLKKLQIQERSFLIKPCAGISFHARKPRVALSSAAPHVPREKVPGAAGKHPAGRAIILSKGRSALACHSAIMPLGNLR
jgi:hypothetical protein